MGSGVTVTYSYSDTTQPDEVTSYAVSGKSPLYFTYDENGGIAGTNVITSSSFVKTPSGAR
jgi:hypothetical protein